jgi:hypothetical protein
MAWTNNGGFTAGNNKTSSSTLTDTISGTLAVGRIVFYAVAFDNLSATDGDNSETISVTDSKGNYWHKVGEFTNSRGAANAGVTVALWASKLTVQLVTGDTWTMTFAGAVTAKAYLNTFLTVGAGNAWQIMDKQVEATTAADPGSMTLTGGTSQEYLFMRVIGGETDSATALTPTTNWTNVGAQTTAGGVATSNIAIRWELRIVTATSDTSDPTFVAVDCASLGVCLKEVAWKSLMPATPRSVYQPHLVR